jgi:hypothetical protein
VIKIIYGILAGLLSAVISLVLAFIVGVVVIAVTTREFFATVLASATVLPLMFLFVLFVPTILLGLLVGVTIGVAAKLSSRVYMVGIAAGLLFAVALLSGVLPLIVVPEPGDFTSIVSRPILAGVYGSFLGLIAARVLHKYGPSSN